MEYLVLYIALACFLVSALVRWDSFKKKIKKKNLQWEKWVEYLGSINALKPETESMDNVSIGSFFAYYKKTTKTNDILPDLLPRWEEFEKLSSGKDKYCSELLTMSEDQKLQLMLNLKSFPLYFMHHKLLENVLHCNQQSVLKEAVCAWAMMPFDFSWNLAWTGLVFLDSPPLVFLTQHIHPQLESKLHLQSSFFSSIEQTEHLLFPAKKTMMQLLSHHDTCVQDLGIYGLGYFKQFQSGDALIHKMESSNKERQKFILHSLRKMDDKMMPEKIYQWITAVQYPEWETMEEIVRFYQSYGNEGDHWIKKLQSLEHLFWKNYFKHQKIQP